MLLNMMQRVFVLIIAFNLILCKIDITYAQNFDINNDGVINSLDLEKISIFFGSDEKEYDLNNDGIVDIIDLGIIAKRIDSNEVEEHVLIVYKNDSLLGTFTKNNLISAISLAAESGGTVKFHDDVIWDNQNYFIYSNNEFYGKGKTIRDSLKIAHSTDNSIVISKNGNIIYNKNMNFRKIIGVTRTAVNLRSHPKMSARTETMIPDGTLIEVIELVNGFYKVLYYMNSNTLLTGYVPSYLDIIQDDMNNSQLGYISAREESNGNPGAVGLNPNDKGGASFGVWQLSSKMGSVDDFLDFIKDKNNDIYTMLMEAKKQDNNKFENNFIEKWKQIAQDYYNTFYELQRIFIKRSYFDAFLNSAKKNNMDISALLDFNSTSNMIWSTSVQHGSGGAINIFKKIPLATNIETIIENVYAERLKIIAKSYSPNSSNPGIVSLYNGIKTRLENEKEEILRVYKRELSY